MTNVSLNAGTAGQSGFGANSLGDAAATTGHSLTGLDALLAEPSFTFEGANGINHQIHVKEDPSRPWLLNQIPDNTSIPAQAKDTNGDGEMDELVIYGAKLPSGYSADEGSRGIYMYQTNDPKRMLEFTPWGKMRQDMIATDLRNAGNATASQFSFFSALFAPFMPGPTIGFGGTAGSIAIITTRPPAETVGQVKDAALGKPQK